MEQRSAMEQWSHPLTLPSRGTGETPSTAVTDLRGTISPVGVRVSPIRRWVSSTLQNTACCERGKSPYPGLNREVR